MCSLFNKSFKTIAYVITPHQVHLSQTTKHWDGFVSHCIVSVSAAVVYIYIKFTYGLRDGRRLSGLVLCDMAASCPLPDVHPILCAISLGPNDGYTVVWAHCRSIHM